MSRGKLMLALATKKAEKNDCSKPFIMQYKETCEPSEMNPDSEEEPFMTDDDRDMDYIPIEATVESDDSLIRTKKLQIPDSCNKPKKSQHNQGLGQYAVNTQGDASDIECSPSFSPITPKSRRPSFKKNPGRKRLAVPKEWIRNKSKKLCNTRQSHTNSRGAIIKARQLKSGCGEQCRRKCSKIITNEARQLIFERFWEIGDKQMQWNFILKNCKQVDKKSVKIGPLKYNRTCSRNYFLPLVDKAGKDEQVCSKMFLDTLGISWKWVETAHFKGTPGLGILSPDKRGKFQRTFNELSNAVKVDVIDHIKSFPQVESHYTRKKSTKLYIHEEGLNCAKMYRLYTEKYAQKPDSERATLRQYRDIFNQEFNISFFIPKADQCNDCTIFQNYNDEEKKLNLQQHELHLLLKDECRKLKDEDKQLASESNGEIIAACFDFQKVLTCPNADVNALYYKRKFAAFNFTIFNMGEKEASCYVWDESIAKKGANEVANCLNIFITSESKKGCKDFRFWSDNCPGQNRYKTVFCFYSWIAYTRKISILHRFLENGHTQNEGDSVHASIERAKKGKTVFVPIQWYSIIRNAKVNGKPDKAIEVINEDFLNFQEFTNKCSFSKCSLNNKIYISKIKELHVKESDPFTVFFKYDIRDKEYQKCVLFSQKDLSNRGRKKKILNPYEEDMKKLYDGALPISVKKKKDLVSLCEGNFIPKLYHPFYKNLNTNNIDSISSSDEDENSGI